MHAKGRLTNSYLDARIYSPSRSLPLYISGYFKNETLSDKNTEFQLLGREFIYFCNCKVIPEINVIYLWFFFMISIQDLVSFISFMTDYIWSYLFFYFRNSSRNNILPKNLLVYISERKRRRDNSLVVSIEKRGYDCYPDTLENIS